MSATDITAVVSPGRTPTPLGQRPNELEPRDVQPRMPILGEFLFGFELKRELGRGAFARVFLAEQSDLAGRPVVLKISKIEGDEPQTLAQLQHTNIVPIHSVHEDEVLGLRAVCMPYFGGTALSNVLESLWKQPPTPTTGAQFVAALEQSVAEPIEPTLLGALRQLDYPRTCAWIVAKLAEALDHAHQRGVIHCDIKPSNVLIGMDGTPMLLDFNVSKTSRADPNVVGGTVAYMAPERRAAILGKFGPEVGSSQPTSSFKNVPTDERCDIYSLGVVLHEMLTNKLPHRSDLSRARRADIPWSLESICRKSLALAPSARYQHARELADDLHRFLEDEPLRYAPELSTRESITKWIRRHPRLRSSSMVGAIAAVLLLAAGASLLSYQRHLKATQDSLEIARAEDHRRGYELGTIQALCLVNTQNERHSHLAQGLQICEKTLGIYGVLDRDDWQKQPEWRRLDDSTRMQLAEDTRELLLLLAWAKVRSDPGAIPECCLYFGQET